MTPPTRLATRRKYEALVTAMKKRNPGCVFDYGIGNGPEFERVANLWYTGLELLIQCGGEPSYSDGCVRELTIGWNGVDTVYWNWTCTDYDSSIAYCI